jgi:hypothetical protein
LSNDNCPSAELQSRVVEFGVKIVAFPVFRFSPADVEAFNHIALPRVLDGSWDPLGRRTCAASDMLLVFDVSSGEAILRFERGADGAYRMLSRSGLSVSMIGSGKSALECLEMARAALPGRSDTHSVRPFHAAH